MFPANQSLCVQVANTTSSPGDKLKAQVQAYWSAHQTDNTIASAFSLQDLKDMVSQIENYNRSNASNPISALRMVKAVVDSSEINLDDSDPKVATIVAVPTFQDEKSVFDVLPMGTPGTTPANPPAMFMSKIGCPRRC